MGLEGPRRPGGEAGHPGVVPLDLGRPAIPGP